MTKSIEIFRVPCVLGDNHQNPCVATMEQLDVYLGFMFIHLNIEKKDKNKVMGSRYTPGTLKQMKTDLQNMLQYVFK